MADFATTWLWVAVLLTANLLVSAGRSALVNSRQAALTEWQASGVPWAGLALRVASNATRLMGALRAGQLLLRLGLLAVVAGVAAAARPQAEPFGRLAATVFGAGLGLGLLEMAGENLVLRSPERWAVRLAPLMAALVWVLAPLGWLIQRGGALLAGPGRGRASTLVTEEAIMTLVDAGEEGGVIEQDEKEMIYSVIRLGDTLAREVMVPRIDILAFEDDVSLEQAADTLLEAGHSRAPVYAETIDNVIGLLYLKDLLAAWRGQALQTSVRDLLREAYFVPEAKKVDDLLAEMQAQRIHMAIVVDEYGGTAGVVTIEDIVEEIVGEIRDEYDAQEQLAYQQLPDGSWLLSGRIGLDEVHEVTGVELPKGSSETLAGLIFSRLGRVPASGETVEEGGLRLVVDQVLGKRIRSVRATRLPQAQGERGENGPQR